MQAIQSAPRISLSNILVATDLSPASELVLPYALALAQQYEAKIFIGHVLKPEPHLGIPLDALPQTADGARIDATRKMAQLIKPLSLGVKFEKTLLQRGKFWPVISDMVEKNHIDLVIAGTRGRKGLSKLALGSHAEAIYRHADPPVLTIGPHVRPLRTAEWKIKQILFPTDGSEASLKALPYALSLAEENQATLIFLQLIFPGSVEFHESEKQNIREALRELVPPEAQPWCTAEFVVRSNFPVDGILRMAEERDADLIVMGVKSSSKNGTHSPWPVASQVVAEARCPVLTIRG